MRSHQLWRLLPVLLLVLALTLPVLPALAQDAGSILSIDTPTDGQISEKGQEVIFVGWAANQGGPGTGVDRVMVLDAPMAAGGVIVAEATYGHARADVGASYSASWMNSGFRATWTTTGSSGNRTFWVYAHSVDNDGWTNKTVTIREVQATVPAPVPAAVMSPASQAVDPATSSSGQYRNPYSGLYDNSYDPYGNLYGQYGNRQGQYGNPYDPYGQTDQYGNQYGSPNTSANCTYNQYSSSYPYAFGSSTGVFGGSLGYGCSSTYPTGMGIVGPTVMATAAADGTIRLIWAAIQNANQYRVYQLSPSMNLVATAPQGFSGSAVGTTLSGLTPGSVQTYQVRAVGSNGAETAVNAAWPRL